MHAKMQGHRTIGIIGLTLRSELNLGGIRGMFQSTQVIENSLNVIKAEDRLIIDGDDVGTVEVITELADPGANGSLNSMEGAGALKVRTLFKLEAKGSRLIVEVESHRNSRNISEGAERDVQIWKREVKVQKVKVLAGAKAIEKASARRFDLEIVHRLVEGNMLGSLDGLSFKVVVADVLHSLGEAKEDADATIRNSRVGTTGASRQSAHSATKDTKVTKVWFLTSLDLMQGSSLITMKGHIAQAKKAMEGAWPELWRKVGTTKHRMSSISNHLMRAFARAALMGGCGGRRLVGVTSILEKFNNCTALAQVTTRIHAHTLARSALRETMM